MAIQSEGLVRPHRWGSDPDASLWPRRLSAALGLVALLGGVVSFSGWALDWPRLTDWVDNKVSIQPNAAVLIALAGVSILLRHYEHRRLSMLLGGLIALVGGLTLLQYIVGVDFGFNHQLLFGRSWGQGTTLTPGRVGPPASISFLLIGSALVMLGVRGARSDRLIRFVPAMALSVAFLMMFSLVGYLFGARDFYSIPWLSAIALQTSSMLMALAISLVVSVPERQPMLMLCERSSAGQMARTVLPILIVMIPSIIWLRGKGQELNLYDLGTSRALGAVALLLCSLALMWRALMALRRRELREREADRRKDEFLATLAHELRNPLAPIQNCLAIMKLSSADPKALGDSREIMERQVNQMVRLIDDLLDVSRVSRGKLELRREQVDLSAMVAQTMEIARSQVKKAGLQVTIALPEHPVFLYADPVRIVQVFSNLIHNACKFTTRGGRIELTAESAGNEAVIRIKDSGIGIPPDKLDSIFEMFTQLDHSLERAHGGLGIGLTLAKRLVELHGGQLEVRSEGLGKGSEFVVRLPLAVDSACIRQELAEVETSNDRQRILVVDDNRDSAQSLATLLKLAGHVVLTAEDGEAAVTSALDWRPEVILLDIGLPKLNGYAACRAIRESPWTDRPIIVAMTGWGQDEDKQRSRDAGFDAHLVKPVKYSALTQLLHSLRSKTENQLSTR